MTTHPGYLTNWFYAPLDASGDPVVASEVMIDGVVDVSPITATDPIITSSPLAGSGRRPVTQQILGPRAPETFSLTMDATGHITQTRLAAARGNGTRIAIRVKRFNSSEDVEATLNLICQVNGFSENPRPQDTHQLVAEFAVITPERPYVRYAPSPFALNNGDTETIELDGVFTSITPANYAIGTIDPSSSASAAAAYSSGMKTLTITADATRTGTTTIPVTATDASGRTGTFSFVVNVS